MAKDLRIRDEQGNLLYPVTVTDLVFDDQTGETLTEELEGKQDTISDLSTIRSGASAGSTAYQKPSGGIPKTDLASAVQTSLGKADTALQTHQDISGKQDVLVSGTNIKTVNNTSLLGSGNISIPKGDPGDDGEDAYQPFKGWFDSSSALSSAYPSPQVGDFAYVKGATSTDPVAIYACATAGTWADSGNTFNPANNQEFASGEALNTVHIVDGLDGLSATDVLSAKQGKVLDQKVAALGPEIGEIRKTINGSVKNYKNGQNYNYTLSPRGTVGSYGKHCREEEYIPVSGGDVIVWHHGVDSTGALGMAQYDSDKNLIGCYQRRVNAADRTVTLSADTSIAFIRASFMLADIADCYVSVNGVKVWQPSENYTGHEQRIAALEAVTPLTESDVVNDLVTGGTDKPLSAEQGKVLAAKAESAATGTITPDRLLKEASTEWEKTDVPLTVQQNYSISAYSNTSKRPVIAQLGNTTLKRYDVRRVKSISFPVSGSASDYYGWPIVFATFEEDNLGLFIARITYNSMTDTASEVCHVENGICTIDVDAAKAGGVDSVFGYDTKNIGYLYLAMLSPGDDATAIYVNEYSYSLSDFKWLDLSEIDSPTPAVILPSKLIAVVGREYNIYKDNVLADCTTNDICLLRTNIVTSTSETSYETRKRLRWTPTATKDSTIKMQLHKRLYSKVDATYNVRVKAISDSVFSGATIRYMVIGDSKVNGGWISYVLNRALTAAGATAVPLGTRDNPNITTVPTEGRNGWTAANYVSLAEKNGVVNAFWNTSESRFDFPYYMSAQGYDGVDAVFINLGTNDASSAADIRNFVTNITTMITSIKAYNSATKIIIGITEPCSQGLFGSIFDISQKIKQLDLTIIEAFDNREEEGIFVCPIYLSIDPENDYTKTEVDLSYGDVYKSNGKKDYIVMGTGGTNQVHQSTVGYTKNAEVMYAVLAYAMQQS